MSKSDKSDKGSKKKNRAEFQQAMDRLEDAVKELGEAAKDNFADRAAQVLEQTAARLKDEQRGSTSAGSASGLGNFDNDSDGDRVDGSLSHWRSDGARRPFRDLDNARLWGICAGVAPYLGLEIWVVRCLAVTIFVFAPQIIVPAYLIAYFVLDPRSELDELTGRSGPGNSRRQRRRYARRRRAERKEELRAQRQANREERRERRREERAKAPRGDRKSPAPTPPAPAPRTVLRGVKGTLAEAEQRLRRMEGHVTSGRYELQKELRKIDTANS